MAEELDRYDLANQLERGSKKLQSRLRGHFVDDHSICVTCNRAQVMRQSSKNRRVIFCGSLGQYMPDDLAECSDYSGVNSLSLHQMSEMATLIDINGRKVGFQGGQ